MTGWLHPACESAPLQSDVHPQLGCYRGHQGSPSRAVSQVSAEEIELGRGTDDHPCRKGGVPLVPAERPLGACSAQARHEGDGAAKAGSLPPAPYLAWSSAHTHPVPHPAPPFLLWGSAAHCPDSQCPPSTFCRFSAPVCAFLTTASSSRKPPLATRPAESFPAARIP